MTETYTRRSPRREGDEYQDLTALRIALENYIGRRPFKMYMEYKKAGSLDDILLFQEDRVRAFQVKYSTNPLAVYGLTDFTDSTSNVYLRKFASSWRTIRDRFPHFRLTVYLCSNRALDSSLVDLLTNSGAFQPKVIENRRRKEARTIRGELASASGLDDDAFIQFLRDFQFQIRRPDLLELKQHIQTVLLDGELGITDTGIFHILKEAIEDNTFFLDEPITLETIDSLLEGVQSKLLIPQVFQVDQKHYVEQKTLTRQLDDVLPHVDGGYLIVSGLPGSGKSTSLSQYFKSLDQETTEVFRYYCFVDVHDNAQRERVQAESFRANLLNEFFRRYPQVIKRRFDDTQPNFIRCLESLARHFVEQNRNFVILLDGLDHAERLDSEVRENVIGALPSNVPQGIVIVVGTQELHMWPRFLKRAQERPETHIKMPLFTMAETEDYLVNKRGITGLSDSDLIEIQRKSEGLPLYLRYVAEVIISNETITDAITSLVPAAGGNIRNYYGLLWEEFEQRDMGNARHICAVMSCLRFPVSRSELYTIQESLSRPGFEDAYRFMSHLLRDPGDRLEIFHDSFREFAISQLGSDWIQEIKENIVEYLRTTEGSSNWFGYVFEYCYETGDHKYILENVNADFVDRALLHYRPSIEIMAGINWAIESAFEQKDVVQLSRLGTLKSRTWERLNHILDRSLLTNVLLALGREKDVVSFALSMRADRWIVDRKTALNILSSLAGKGNLEFGQRLFQVFMEEFRDINSEDENEADDDGSVIIGISRCLGIYSDSLAKSLQWLSQFEFTPGMLEQSDGQGLGYAPHLEAYIDALVQFGHTPKWKRIKDEGEIFTNRLVRYLLIQALARHDLIDDLRTMVNEYVEKEHPRGILELAFYAARAGLDSSRVSEIAGLIETPKFDRPGRLNLINDPVLMQYAYSLVILSYEGNESAYRHLGETVGISATLWNCTLRHLLCACRCIGLSFRKSEYDWYAEACESIKILLEAEQGEGERIVELLGNLRAAVSFTVSSLTKEIQQRFPDRLDAWIENLVPLRNSLLWNTHFGVSESIQDFSMELNLWETLADNFVVRPKLSTILNSCAATYEESTLLKGESRSRHFLRLAELMANCGMREEAERWLKYGIRSSLSYGYHKDSTLSFLIDVLRLLNLRQPEQALERCARVLWMEKWMPHLTDGDGTQYFTEKAFRSVLAVNRQAAFDLLSHFWDSVARWKVENCLEEFILAERDGDPEYLWCLSESLSDQNTKVKVREHLVSLVRESSPSEIQEDFEGRLRHFVLTEVAPNHWPDALKDEFNVPSEPGDDSLGDSCTSTSGPKEFKLDGEKVTKSGIVEKCRDSFSKFLETFEKLGTENEHFFEPDISNKMLRYHVSNSSSLRELLAIKSHITDSDHWTYTEIAAGLAERFLELGDQENALTCFGLAYASRFNWYDLEDSTKYLTATVEKDRDRAKIFLLERCYDSASGPEGGFNTAIVAATGLEVLNETSMIEEVFEDYLGHCESLFAQLPRDCEYSWLKDYEDPSLELHYRFLDFSLKELSTNDFDLGQRLIRALTRLSLARHEDVISRLLAKALSASGRTLRRLLMVFHTIAYQKPVLLSPHQQALAQFLEREDFLCRSTGLYILSCVESVSPLEPSVTTAIQLVDRKYSTSMSDSSYRMSSNPSEDFSDFFESSTLFDFCDQVKLVERILRNRPGSLISAIEESLDTKSWSMREERTRLKNDFSGRRHPQGWPMVWITTGFQEIASEAMWKILNEAAEKMMLSPSQVSLLWQTTQVVDPEYVVQGVVSRPSDVETFHVADKDLWFSDLDKTARMQIGDTDIESQKANWITVFEMRRRNFEGPRHSLFRKQELLQGTLIPLQFYGRARALDELELKNQTILESTTMSITLEQARDAVLRAGTGWEAVDDSLPLLAVHRNPSSFTGYEWVCTLASNIISDFNLSFTGFDLAREGEVVAKYESWEDGYQNERYTREKLSSGVRVRVRRDFLASVCFRYQKMLCVQIEEYRQYHEYSSNRNPDEEGKSHRYLLYHL